MNICLDNILEYLRDLLGIRPFSRNESFLSVDFTYWLLLFLVLIRKKGSTFNVHTVNTKHALIFNVQYVGCSRVV